MNAASVRAIPESNGFRAELKRVHRSKWEPVRDGHLFATEAEAKVAAHEALLEHLVGDRIVSTGFRAERPRAVAAAIFRPGKRPIQVERCRCESRATDVDCGVSVRSAVYLGRAQRGGDE